MRAVTFHAPGEVRVEEKPEPELTDPGEAVVRVEASGVCGSDLHIYHGRVAIEPGFTIGHEYVGTVSEVGDEVTSVVPGDRVLGTYCTACNDCFFCARGDFHKCDHVRVFGHGKLLGELQGSQAESLLVPNADLTLRKVPEGMSDDVALFAGDLMGTGYHAVAETGVGAGDTAAVLGLGPVGLCAVQAAFAAGVARVIAIDTVADRLEMARRFGADPVHLTDEDPRAAAKTATEGRGVDASIDAVGHPDRRLRRADGGPHGRRLDQGPDGQDRTRQRDQARRSRPRGACRGAARPQPARHPSHEARRRGRGL